MMFKLSHKLVKALAIIVAIFLVFSLWQRFSSASAPQPVYVDYESAADEDEEEDSVEYEDEEFEYESPDEEEEDYEEEDYEVSPIGAPATVDTSMLPKQDPNFDEFAKYAPKNLGGRNLLSAPVAIDTIGSTMRNSSRDLRPVPAIPKMNVSPWNQSSIEPDPYRPNLFQG
jgi:hypothetical protein